MNLPISLTSTIRFVVNKILGMLALIHNGVGRSSSDYYYLIMIL